MKFIFKYRYAIIIVIWAVLLVYRLLRNRQEEQMLETLTGQTNAIVDGVSGSRYGSALVVKYAYGTKEYRELISFVNFLEIGDTILIKYSLRDPTVIELVDPCVMKKHQGTVPCISWKQKNEAAKRRKRK